MIDNNPDIALKGTRIFTGEKLVDGQALLVSGGKVAGICQADAIPSSYHVENLSGGILAPGFIDVQVNGGGGVFFNDDPSVEGVSKISQAHRAYGTTSMLPTLISDNLDKMERACLAIEDARKLQLPGILGIHIEGPYLNLKRKGVHDPDIIRQFDDEVLNLLSTDKLGPSILTVAPETLPVGTLKMLVSTGFKICAGHTAATYDEIQIALRDGLSGFTHLFNAMTPMDSRAPGVVGAALEDANSYCAIIVDGHHIHPATLKVAIAAKKTGRMMLVTDAMPSVGMKDKAFQIRGEDIIVEGGCCMTKEGTLAGSDLDMMSAVKNSVEMLEIDITKALKMASLYPAQYLGVDSYLGKFEKGYQADIVHFTSDFNVKQTWIKGRTQTH